MKRLSPQHELWLQRGMALGVRLRDLKLLVKRVRLSYVCRSVAAADAEESEVASSSNTVRHSPLSS